MAKSAGQNDLRKMMKKIKNPTNNDRLKKYKLSSRELQLIEAQKKKESEAKAFARSQQRSLVKTAPSSDSKPVKSILKKKTDNQSTFGGIGRFTTESTIVQPAVVDVQQHQKHVVNTLKRKIAADEKSKNQDNSDNQTNLEDQSSLPEGFFDNPILDAKARKVEYKDPVEEEWDKFKKEIGQEIETAKDIVEEEQKDSTIERQIDEVDEQIRAWEKVSTFEKKLELIEKKVKDKKSKIVEKKDESSDEDNDDDDIFDWRKKC